MWIVGDPIMALERNTIYQTRGNPLFDYDTHNKDATEVVAVAALVGKRASGIRHIIASSNHSSLVHAPYPSV
jgi:hypothetical protein